MSPIPGLHFPADQEVLLEDKEAIINELGDGHTWYQAFATSTNRAFWLCDGLFEWTEPEQSLSDLLRFFEETWDGTLKDSPKFCSGFDTLEKNTFSHLTHSKIIKKPFGLEAQKELIRDIYRIGVKRPPTSTLTVERQDSECRTFYPSSLEKLEDLSSFPVNFLSFQGPGKQRSFWVHPYIEQQDTPFQYLIYLNVEGEGILKLLLELLPKMDAAKQDDKTDIVGISVSPLQNIRRRPDTFCITINTEKGFEDMKRHIIQYVQQHEDVFVDDCLAFTKRFAKGASWCLDIKFSNVWEMDERLMASVSRFFGRVESEIKRLQKKAKGWFDTESEGKWRHLHTLLTHAKMNFETRPKDRTYSDLLRLNNHADVSGITGLSENVVEWITHFKRYTAQSDAVDGRFFAARSNSFADLLKMPHGTRPEALRTLMGSLTQKGVDFFHPHMNLPIAPFRDEQMLVVDTEGPQELDGSNPTGAEAVHLPIPEIKERTNATFNPDFGFELPEVSPKTEEDEVRDSLSKVYVSLAQGDQRQKKPSKDYN